MKVVMGFLQIPFLWKLKNNIMRLCSNCHNQPVFGTDKLTKLGYCKGCQYKRTDLDKRSITVKGLEKAKKKAGFFDINKVDEDFTSGVSVMDEAEIEAIRKEEMSLFWKKAESVIAKKPYFWECGDFISPKDYRAATAHIFMKSIFESVASNEWNFVVLGARCGCHNLSHRLDTFSKMKVFPTAVNRFVKFGHLITEKHKYLTLFKEYASQINE